jgi:integrase
MDQAAGSPQHGRRGAGVEALAKVTKRTWTTSKGENRQAWQVDFSDADGVRQRKQFETKRDADDFRVELEGQLKSGTFRRGADKVTVKEVATDYIAHIKKRVEKKERFTQGHFNSIQGQIWNYICPDLEWRKGKPKTKVRPFLPSQGIGHLTLAKLSPKRVKDFRDRLREAGVSVVMTRKILTNLHALLAYAIGEDLIATNAAHGIKVIGRRDEGAKKIVPPPKAAMRSLLSVADADFRVHLVLAAAAAPRAGEQRALRWRHVNFKTDELTIETRVDSFGTEDVTKTAAGMRVVPLGRAVVTELKALNLRSKFNKDDDLIFPNKKGGYLGHDNMVKRKFKPLFDLLDELHEQNPRKYPKVERFNWHALRHYGISTWIEADLKPKTVQTFAGHSSLQVTMDRYGHLFKSDDHAKAMDDIAKKLLS